VQRAQAGTVSPKAGACAAAVMRGMQRVWLANAQKMASLLPGAVRWSFTAALGRKGKCQEGSGKMRAVQKRSVLSSAFACAVCRRGEKRLLPRGKPLSIHCPENRWGGRR